MKEKPAAKVLTPGVGSSPEGTEALQEVMENASRKYELDARNQAKANKVAALLGGTYYVQEETWPFLVWQGRQWSVSEFYPESKIAIDKFYRMEELDQQLVAFKKKTLKEHGIRYAYLTPDKSLADLEADLEG